MRKIAILISLLVIAGILGFTSYLIYKKYSKPTPPKEKPSEEEWTDLGKGFKVLKIDSEYKIAKGKTSGFFKTGQAADMMLSGIDFNNTGGPLLFNHLGGVASDGKHLILTDRNNNRVLIWNKLPEKNEEPVLVLGQKDFTSNNPGSGLDGLNWPVGVAFDGTHLIVADTYNDRILIWNSFPNQNKQAADLEIKGEKGKQQRSEVIWPWAVWTNGQKMIVASTGAAKVLIWNSIPTQNNQEADIVLDLKDAFGTPRSIGSDGKHLIIGDHNAKVNGAQGNFFWKNFPTSDNQNYNFFMPGIMTTQSDQPSGTGQSCDPPPAPCPPSQSESQSEAKPPTVKGISTQPGDIFWSPVFTPEGKVITLAGSQLVIWNSFPEGADDAADLTIGASGGQESKDQYAFLAGDGSGVALAGEKLYLSLSNGNKIVGYKKIPSDPNQKPDFAIGSPDIETNTLETSFIISNPTPVSDGKSLFVSSDFDRKLYVWKNLPDESGAHPDLVYSLPEGPWDNELYKGQLVLAGKKAVYLWKTLPTDSRLPDLILTQKIGSIEIGEIQGVAMDEKYFYLSDGQSNKIYIWEGLPNENSDPKFSLSTERPGRLSSDGKYLVDTSGEKGIRVYKIDELSGRSQPALIGGPGKFNLPQSATLSNNHLFIGDTGYNRVLIWKNIEDALAGKEADILLGLTEKIEKPEQAKPQIGKDKLFWPAIPYFDGKYLWVGEFKFSERILRFSPSD